MLKKKDPLKEDNASLDFKVSIISTMKQLIRFGSKNSKQVFTLTNFIDMSVKTGSACQYRVYFSVTKHNLSSRDKNMSKYSVNHLREEKRYDQLTGGPNIGQCKFSRTNQKYKISVSQQSI